MDDAGTSAVGLADDDSFEQFNRAMGAEGDAMPYPTRVSLSLRESLSRVSRRSGS